MCGQELRLCEAVLACQDPPRLERQRVGDPGVPAVRVVLHEEQATAGPEHRTHARQHRVLLLHEVQGVRHDDPVEIVEVEVPREVTDLSVDKCRRPTSCETCVRPLELGQRAAIPVDGVNDRAWGKELGERERERAGTRSQVGPNNNLARALADNTIPQQPDMVGVVH